MMNDILIYGGIALNVVGALYLMAYAIKYGYAFNKVRNRQIETDALRPGWGRKRIVGFGLMLLGLVITLVGCYV